MIIIIIIYTQATLEPVGTGKSFVSLLFSLNICQTTWVVTHLSGLFSVVSKHLKCASTL